MVRFGKLENSKTNRALNAINVINSETKRPGDKKHHLMKDLLPVFVFHGIRRIESPLFHEQSVTNGVGRNRWGRRVEGLVWVS